MAALANLGTAVLNGATVNLDATLATSLASNYIIVSCVEGKRQVDGSPYQDAFGADVGEVIHNRHPVLELTLLVKTGSTPMTTTLIQTDFPEGAMCTLSGGTDFRINSAPINKAKTPWTVVVTMTKQFTNV